MRRTFEYYGTLCYMHPDVYYSTTKATIYERFAVDSDGEEWTIVLLDTEDGQEFRFSDI